MKIQLLPVLLTAWLALNILPSQAQLVPNGDFESDISQGWVGRNVSRVDNITVNTPDGQRQVRANGSQYFATVSNTDQQPGILATRKFALNGNPTGIRFQTMYFPQGGDQFAIAMQFTKAARYVDSTDSYVIDTIINVLGRPNSASIFPWQDRTFIINDSLYKGETADSGFIAFLPGGNPGSALALDDIFLTDYGLSDRSSFVYDPFTGNPVAYPNPASDRFKLSYVTNMTSRVTIKMYDIQGREVKQILDQDQDNGEHEEEVDVSDLPKGIYFVKITNGNNSKTIKVSVR